MPSKTTPEKDKQMPKAKGPAMTYGDSQSVFQSYKNKVYKYRYAAEIVVSRLVGGVPSDPNVALSYLKTKFQDKDTELHELVAQIMLERNMDDVDKAIEAAAEFRHLNGFFRNLHTGELCIAGYQVKAAIKEAANIRWPKERWGPTNKGTVGFFAEHFFVPEERIGVGVKEPDGVQHRFVHTWRGSAIAMEEFVDNARMSFTIRADFDLGYDRWAELWTTGEEQAIGAVRPMFGRYKVTKWEQIK